MAKKAGKLKLDKHGHNFVIFRQTTRQTWYHTSACHLSALGQPKHLLTKVKHFSVTPAQELKFSGC